MRKLIEAYTIAERWMKLNNQLPFHLKILIAFVDNIGLINYYKGFSTIQTYFVIFKNWSLHNTLTEVLKICSLMHFSRSCFWTMLCFRYVVIFLNFCLFLIYNKKYYLSQLMLLNFRCQHISLLCKHIFSLMRKMHNEI